VAGKLPLFSAALLIAASIAMIACVGASSHQSPPPPPPNLLGSVSGATTLPTCPDGFSAGETCYSATVSCPSTADIQVTFGVLTPAGAPNGTIAFFIGGGGTVPAGGEYITSYAANGFQTVEVVWDTDWETTGTTANVKTAACRPATLLYYIHQKVYQAGGMCAQGFSAGSAAVAYALTEYGAGSYLDNVELESGPVLADMAAGCNPTSPPVTVCASGCNTGQEGGWSDAPQFVNGDDDRINRWSGVSGNNVCTGSDIPSSQYTAWKQMSVVDGLPDSTFSFPKTAMAGWLCSDTSVDCQGGACQNNSAAEGQIFYSQIVNPSAPFAVYRIDQCDGDEGIDTGFLPPPNNQLTGFDAVSADMISNCTLRH
jgi:hypothetical protein